MIAKLRLNKQAKPSIQDRTLQAHGLTTGALSTFEQSVKDLEVAAALKEEIAAELDGMAAALRDEADELDAQAIALDGAAEADLDAADRIRSLFAKPAA